MPARRQTTERGVEARDDLVLGRAAEPDELVREGRAPQANPRHARRAVERSSKTIGTVVFGELGVSSGMARFPLPSRLRDLDEIQVRIPHIH